MQVRISPRGLAKLLIAQHTITPPKTTQHNNNFNNNASTGVRSHFGSSSSLLSIATERACRQAFTKIPIGDLDAATSPSSTRERRRAT